MPPLLSSSSPSPPLLTPGVGVLRPGVAGSKPSEGQHTSGRFFEKPQCLLLESLSSNLSFLDYVCVSPELGQPGCFAQAHHVWAEGGACAQLSTTPGSCFYLRVFLLKCFNIYILLRNDSIFYQCSPCLFCPWKDNSAKRPKGGCNEKHKGKKQLHLCKSITTNLEYDNELIGMIFSSTISLFSHN